MGIHIFKTIAITNFETDDKFFVQGGFSHMAFAKTSKYNVIILIRIHRKKVECYERL